MIALSRNQCLVEPQQRQPPVRPTASRDRAALWPKDKREERQRIAPEETALDRSRDLSERSGKKGARKEEEVLWAPYRDGPKRCRLKISERRNVRNVCYKTREDAESVKGILRTTGEDHARTERQ